MAWYTQQNFMPIVSKPKPLSEFLLAAINWDFTFVCLHSSSLSFHQWNSNYIYHKKGYVGSHEAPCWLESSLHSTFQTHRIYTHLQRRESGQVNKSNSFLFCHFALGSFGTCQQLFFSTSSALAFCKFPGFIRIRG